MSYGGGGVEVQLSRRDGSVLQITSALTLCISESLAGIPALPLGVGIWTRTPMRCDSGSWACQTEGSFSSVRRRPAAPGEGRAGWVTVARRRHWTCCWLRQGHWQAPLLLPITPGRSGFRPLVLTGTCKIQGEIINVSSLVSVCVHVCICIYTALCAAIQMFTCIYGDILKQAKLASLQPYIVLSTAKIFLHQFFSLIQLQFYIYAYTEAAYVYPTHTSFAYM